VNHRLGSISSLQCTSWQLESITITYRYSMGSNSTWVSSFRPRRLNNDHYKLEPLTCTCTAGRILFSQFNVLCTFIRLYQHYTTYYSYSRLNSIKNRKTLLELVKKVLLKNVCLHMTLWQYLQVTSCKLLRSLP